MRINFNDLLLRADEEVLQRLLGRPTIRLMRATLGHSLTVRAMRDALLSVRPPHRLLSNADDRQLLLEMLSPDESASISVAIGCSSPQLEHVLAHLRKHPSVLPSLMSVLCVDLPAHEARAASPPTVEECKPRRYLFPHQRSSMRKVQESLSRYPHRVLLHMPTGSGKTRTAMQIAAHHLVEKGPTTVVWLATSEELCDQAVAEFAATWQQAGDTEAKLIRAWGPHTLSLDSMLFEQNMFVVAGLAKLHSASRSDQQILPKLGDNVSLVIFDEAHQAIADTYRTVVDTLVARNANTQLLGLSATPGRSWNNPDLDRQLATYFGHSKVQLEVDGYRSPIDYLMHEGYLAHPNFTRIPHTPQGSLTDSQLQSLASALDVPEALREQFAQDELRNVAIVQECRRLIRKHKRALVFASTVSHSDLLAMVLQALGVAAHSLTGNTDRAERSRLIHWFHSDDPEARMLVNYGILTTGFDEPKTSAVLIARPTKSLVLYSQMVGRALRGPRAGGNPSAEVVTIVDTALPGFGDLVSAFNNWEDVW